MYKVRFHLASGPNFMHWQVKSKETENVLFFNPEKYRLYMHDCKLINQPSTAKKIYQGMNKSVCAWIECSSFGIVHERDWNDCQKPYYVQRKFQLNYNPRIVPYWHNCDFENIDKKVYKELATIKNKVYTTT